MESYNDSADEIKPHILNQWQMKVQNLVVQSRRVEICLRIKTKLMKNLKALIVGDFLPWNGANAAIAT